MSEETGTVELDELPETAIYLQLKPELQRHFDSKIREIGIKRFAKTYQINESILSRWIIEGSTLRLDIYKQVIAALKIETKATYKHIKFLRGRSGFRITNPKLPFDFRTVAGVRFIAALLGDGWLDKKYRVFYGNSTSTLIDGFIEDGQNIFGGVGYDKRTNKKGVTIISYPPICGRVSSVIGLNPGPKVVINPKIPVFIFILEKDKKWHFLSQLLDDEGSVNSKARYVKINLAVVETHPQSNILHGFGQLLDSLGLNFSIYKGDNYPSTKGPRRDRWTLQISGSEQLRLMSENLASRHQDKVKKLRNVCNSYVSRHFQRRKAQQTYISLMKSIQVDKDHFTSRDVALASGRALGSCRNTIMAYRKRGLIVCTEPQISGSCPACAKYRVVE